MQVTESNAPTLEPKTEKSLIVALDGIRRLLRESNPPSKLTTKLASRLIAEQALARGLLPQRVELHSDSTEGPSILLEYRKDGVELQVTITEHSDISHDSIAFSCFGDPRFGAPCA